MHYDPILCMNVPDKVTTKDELSLAQKKRVVVELKGFLKKSYNFSDESEYARAYEDLRHMFNTGSRKSISGLFENTVKKTGAHDSASALDKAISVCKKKTRTKDAPRKNWTVVKQTKPQAGKERWPEFAYISYSTTFEPGKMKTEKVNPEKAKEFMKRKDVKWEGLTKEWLYDWIRNRKYKDDYAKAEEKSKKEDLIWASMGDPNVAIRRKHGTFIVYKDDKPIFLTGSESDAYKKYYSTAIDMIKQELKKDPNSIKSKRYMDLRGWDSKFKEIREYYKKLTGKDYFDKNKG